MNSSFSNWLDFYIHQPWDYTWFSLAHPQSHWINGHKIDKIFKYENLNEIYDLKYLQGIELTKTNGSFNGKIDYRDIFNSKSKELIDTYYKEDLEKFEYSF